MADPSDDMLREAARARGFRLVKSRRRKPGGDFGRYGLVDVKSGRECVGFGRYGLTATVEEVLAYLRGGEVASWRRSLIGVVEAAPTPAPAPKPSARPERSRGAPAPKGDQREERTTPGPSTKARRGAFESDRSPSATAGGASVPKGDQREERTTSGPSTKARRGAFESDRSPPAFAGGAGGGPSSLQEVTIREATRRDAAAIARLLGIAAKTLTERLAAAIRADEPPLVAEQDGVVGIAAATTIATLHDGPHGRITLLLVAEEHRRQGLGTRLLTEAEKRLRDAGVEGVELAVEIDFDAPTAFLRRTGYTRTTNGYGKSLAGEG